jgi:WhiB family redox-sensing transcriptional regulator
MDDANCVTVSPDIFFPEKGDVKMSGYALSVCGECVVKEACLEYALSNRYDDGIFGGLTPNGRRKLIRQVKRMKGK